jgi:hypothetical protein
LFKVIEGKAVTLGDAYVLIRSNRAELSALMQIADLIRDLKRVSS